ncbi:precorrin-6A reductase [Hippea alviniae]|uniref:precorrin-6A reductase n=1 Tax=Hippea alviniae TaxID=1279027 RepID=UPI00040C9350|nr:precorrin-6A reductase [Hippea alviniae]
MILLLAGTTESKEIAKKLKENFIISVATDYGYESFKRVFPNTIKANFDEESLAEFIKKKKITKIIDATHPFAFKISQTAKRVALKMKIEYKERKRKLEASTTYKKALFFSSKEDIFDFLRCNCKRIFFTIGSKRIDMFKEFFDNSIFRILPYENSIKHLRNLGINPKNIIAMEGLFSKNFNIAIIEEFDIDCIVTKNSGREGGLNNKIEAAKDKNIYILILQPDFFSD